MWHWAHKNLSPDCKGYEETEWHRQWKAEFPPPYSEIRHEKNGVLKIADLKLPSGLVVEFQHSNITPEEIKFREEYYKDMFWVFDIRDSFTTNRFTITNRWASGCRWSWLYPKRVIACCSKKVYLDIGKSVVLIQDKYFENTPYYGTGIEYDRGEFINFLFKYL